MNAADLDRVFEIALALPEAPHWSLSSYVAAIDPMHTPRRIALVSTDPDNDAPTGFVIASLLPPEAELETIAVAPSGQRQGVGSRLLSVLAEELRNEHVNQLILEVRASNLAALRFYRAYGFKQTGRRTRYYSDPEEDAVLMGLSLV
jgi:ribosomal-protein-alanine N-acetyltransferase